MDVSEIRFLESYDATAFERPSVAVDVVLLTIRDEQLEVLLVRRAENPQRGKWSLPGGFVDVALSLDDNAKSVLERKAGLRDIYLEQLYTFGALRRDPRTRIITVAYYALVESELLRTIEPTAHRLTAAVRVPWTGETGGPVDVIDDCARCLAVAFDHAEIIGMTIKRLRGKLAYTPVGYELLPKRFTLLQLQRVHEIIYGMAVNKDSFRRRMLASGELDATSATQAGVGHRPATLYRLRTKRKA